MTLLCILHVMGAPPCMAHPPSIQTSRVLLPPVSFNASTEAQPTWSAYDLPDRKMEKVQMTL